MPEEKESDKGREGEGREGGNVTKMDKTASKVHPTSVMVISGR